MIINIEEIKKLIEDQDITAYSISKETGITRQVIQNYRNGEADIMNMSLKNAGALQRYIDRRDGHKSYSFTLKHLDLIRNGLAEKGQEVEEEFEMSLPVETYLDILSKRDTVGIYGDEIEAVKKMDKEDVDVLIRYEGGMDDTYRMWRI